MEAWTLDKPRLARELSLAFKEAGLTKKEVGQRIAPDVPTKATKVSHWTTKAGCVDLDEPQIMMIFGTMRESREARDRILRFFDIPIPETPREVEDPELADWIAEARYAWQHQGNAAIKALVNGLREVVGGISGGQLRKPVNGDGGA